jgi:hypothetical protein
MKKSEASELRHSLFRDPLGNHGDYSQGIYYQGRRRYLYANPAEIAEETAVIKSPTAKISSSFPSVITTAIATTHLPHCLEPPKDMMTNKQVA